jgi:uncharacterized protein with GYD domain
MRKSNLLVAALAISVATPAMAQEMRHYLGYFTYSDAAMKAMTENPQDREAAARKLAESFGGKMDAIYWMNVGHDGFVIWEWPDDITAKAVTALTRSTGNFQGTSDVIPLMNAAEFKAAMQKVKDVKATTGYTVPTQTK